MSELNSCDRDYVPCKAENIYSLVLTEKVCQPQVAILSNCNPEDVFILTG